MGAKSEKKLWMKEHDLHTFYSPHVKKNDGWAPWAAWQGKDHEPWFRGGYAIGETENRALKILAKHLNIKTWKEKA